MKVLFNVAHLYYLPQYLPVWNELKKRGVSSLFVFHKDPEMMSILHAVIKKEKLPAKWVTNDLNAVNLYQAESADWVIFGDRTSQISLLPDNVRTALLYHGIGVKSCYYDADLMGVNVRFVEGEYRLHELHRRYPGAKLVSTGFAKLDPILSPGRGEMSFFDLESAGLNPNRPTLLYAPTFYPSSIERMPDDWPKQFGNYNLIVKPHFFTFCKARYRYQRKKLKRWRYYNNTYIAAPEEYSLLPFMASSDLLISEASSAFFEFAALDKPIVWCDFLKLRWSY
ncbi:MAG: CDP-glycerol glycerophosphotransferase family protein, partial [Desulfobacterales bacterium]